MKIHIVVPAYNESESLASCIHILTKLYPESTITIAEDGSTDGTDQIARKLIDKPLFKLPFIKYPDNLFLSSYPTRGGKGAAIKRVLLPNIVNAYIDADCSVHPHALYPMYQILLEKGGLIVAKRIPLYRKRSRTLASKLYNGLVRCLFWDGISDHQCGCKLLSAEAVTIAQQVKADGFLFDTELILRCKHAGLSVTEYPVSWVEYKNKSAVKTIRDGTKMFLGVLKLWIKL